MNDHYDIDNGKGVGVDKVSGIALTIIVWKGTFVLDTTLVMICFVSRLCPAEFQQTIILKITKHMETVVRQLRLSSWVDR
jgi:hypothetical protein